MVNPDSSQRQAIWLPLLPERPATKRATGRWKKFQRKAARKWHAAGFALVFQQTGKLGLAFADDCNILPPLSGKGSPLR
jgi:hypothetical protein